MSTPVGALSSGIGGGVELTIYNLIQEMQRLNHQVITVAPQGGTPPHRHTRENESFYVQEGELEFQIDDRTLIATTGTFLHSPKGQIHRFTNVTAKPAKLLVWVTPAGFEKFIAEVGKAVNGQVTSGAFLTSEDLEKILTTAPKYGIEIIPPPSEEQ